MAQGDDVARLEVMELAADPVADRVHRTHLELDAHDQRQVVDGEGQFALVVVAGRDRVLSRQVAEAAGGKLLQAVLDQVLVLAGETDPRRNPHPGMLALDFRFMHDVDGGIHGGVPTQIHWLGSHHQQQRGDEQAGG
ncbi:hypothetical protein D9M72_596120 [compost metagenome]